MMRKAYDLNIQTDQFNELVKGKKKFIVTDAKKDYKVDDRLVLNEYDPTTKKYTGKCKFLSITSIVTGKENGLRRGYYILGVKSIKF